MPKIAICDRALEILEGLGEAELAHETRVVRSYVELARGVYWVAEQVATLDLGDMENQALVRGSLDQLQKAGQDKYPSHSGLARPAWGVSRGTTGYTMP